MQARNDIDVVKMRDRMGNMRAYGTYWCIIEILTESKRHALKLSDVPIIALQIGESAEYVETLIKTSGLFEFAGEYFYSPRLISVLKELEKLIQHYTNNPDQLTLFEEPKKKSLEQMSEQELITAIADSEDFKKLWNTYAKFVGKKEAMLAWNSLTKLERAEAISNVHNYLNSLSDKKYQMNLSKWLINKRFNDSYETQTKKQMPERLSLILQLSQVGDSFVWNGKKYTKISNYEVKDELGNFVLINNLY